MIDKLEKELNKVWDEIDYDDTCPICGCEESGCDEIGCRSDGWEDGE